MDPLERNNVRVSGRGDRTVVFAHGFGCDQGAWAAVAPAFESDSRVVLFDHVGAGGSTIAAYDFDKYARLDGYAADVVDVLDALDVADVVFVGHSVGAMIGLLAAGLAPQRIGRLVMLCPSPCYVDDGAYAGGFSRADIDDLLEVIDSNFLGWARAMAPAVMGNPERPQLGAMLADSFCRTDPNIAKAFARVTFLSDRRADVAAATTPALILQTREDMIAPMDVSRWMQANLRGSRLMVMDATGHCPHMSAPAETIAAIRGYVAS